MRRGDWPCTLSHRLSGSTLGIFGLGTIGSIVARAGAGMGMNVLAWGQETSAAKAKAAGYDFAASKADLFERSDVLSLHVRLRPDTSGIVGPDDLARMKPTVAAGQHLPRGTDPAWRPAGGVARRPSRLRRRRCV